MEWAIFDALEKQGLHRKIDEIFVEFHFDREYDKHPPGPRTKYKGADNWAPAARRSYPYAHRCILLERFTSHATSARLSPLRSAPLLSPPFAHWYWSWVGAISPPLAHW
tara:strand:- start:301 stop:627 length:327 start_codon:yes stop_codon:yes gene_type:complete